MNPYRNEGIGWLSTIFIALGAMIAIVNGLDLDFWLLNVFQVIPIVFGLIMLASGLALVLAGFIERNPDR